MSKDEKRNALQKNAATVDGVNAIDDNDLADVSGGLGGITLLDTCPKHFEYLRCCKNFGKCPNLIINNENVRNAGLFKKAYSYVFSCSKGYYSQVSWADNAEDED
jgi:hypothetical protein